MVQRKLEINLSESELERLAILSEELGECIQIIGKIIRFGYENSDPFDKESKTNRRLLEIELGHVQALIELMISNKDVNKAKIGYSLIEKLNKLKEWTKYQDL